MDYKFPTAICVLGEWITIKYVDEIEHESDLIHGDFCEVDNLIRIRKNKPEWMWRVLTHEITHAVIAKSAWSEVLKDHEEGVCKLFEHFSHFFALRPNSKAVKWRDAGRCKYDSALKLRARKSAHAKVAYAVRTGKLIRPSQCANCQKECKPQGHHHKGYEKPLEVVWLCQQCHTARHKAGEDH